MMTEKSPDEPYQEDAESLSASEKKTEQEEKIQRTLIACIMGLIAGVLSFYLSGNVDPATGLQPEALLGIFILLAGIVLQKHIFMLMHLDYTNIGVKDWFYQGFMTFTLWFISWTILLSTTLLSPM